MNVEPNSRKQALKVIIDVACLLTVGIPIYIYFLSDKPYQRGFFCDDESLRHPYMDSTVPSWMLYTVGLGLPIVVIMVTEYALYMKASDSKTNIRFMKKKVPSWLWECYRHIGVFLFGALCSQLLTDIAKYTIGRLRPHFFDVCKPDVDCFDEQYKYMYITNFTCQETNEKLLKDVRLSFPSGHSSFSAYCMVFLVMYIQVKMTWKGSKLLKHTLQYICIVLALYTALTRISDYKHHWSDVLAGCIEGVVVAIIVVIFIAEFHPKFKKSAVPASPQHDLAMR